MNSAFTRKINGLNRSQLITVAKKLGITGMTNKRKDDIRLGILKFLKTRRNSTSTLETIKMVPSVSKRPLQRSKSENSVTSRTYRPRTSPNTSPAESKIFSIDHCSFPPVRRLVCIGDIHGDLMAAIKALKLAGVIDVNIPNNTQDITRIHWTGGNTYVVQLGDQIDRVRPASLFNSLCPLDDPDIVEDEGSDLKIITLFNRLHYEALKSGGACLSVLGNHELMNVEGDFRYVSPKEFREFGNFFKADKSKCDPNVPYGFRERQECFRPGGALAKKLADTRYSVLQVGSWLFLHGGITSHLASKYTLGEINSCVRRWLYGEQCNLVDAGVNDIYHNEDDTQSPFWSRIYSDVEEFGVDERKEFYKTLKVLNLRNRPKHEIRGMVMGHSPQFMYGKPLNSDCNNKLWRVDIGMSRAFGRLDSDPNRKVQVLLIENDNKFSIMREQ